MRYLTCFEPIKTLTERLGNESGLVLPSSGLHCTIVGFNLWEKYEGKLVEALSGLEGEPFYTKIIGHSQFDLGSHVLLLTKPEELQDLHEKVIRTVRPFDKNKELFDEMMSRYGLGQYQPHITISKTKELELTESYDGICMHVSSYLLLKKNKGVWQKVAQYGLSFP